MEGGGEQAEYVAGRGDTSEGFARSRLDDIDQYVPGGC